MRVQTESSERGSAPHPPTSAVPPRGGVVPKACGCARLKAACPLIRNWSKPGSWSQKARVFDSPPRLGVSGMSCSVRPRTGSKVTGSSRRMRAISQRPRSRSCGESPRANWSKSRIRTDPHSASLRQPGSSCSAIRSPREMSRATTGHIGIGGGTGGSSFRVATRLPPSPPLPHLFENPSRPIADRQLCIAYHLHRRLVVHPVTMLLIFVGDDGVQPVPQT